MSLENELKDCIAQKRSLIEPLDLFDANVWLGKPQGFPLAHEILLRDQKETDTMPAPNLSFPRKRGSRPTSKIGPATLNSILKMYAIKGACISHWLGLTASPQDGNTALIEIAEELTDNQFLIYTALPPSPAEPAPLPGPDTNLPKLRAVRIFPRSHEFPPTPNVLDNLARWLSEKAIPLFLWHTEIEWPDLNALAQAFPHLNIVLESQPQKLIYHTESVLELMQNCPNIYLEISNLVAPDLLTYTVNHLGPDRLLFGSFLPVSDPFVPISLIGEAPLSLTDKQLIAGGNLRRLLEAVRC